MVLNDVSIVKFTYGIDADGERWEKLDESTRNKHKIHLISPSIGTHNSDLSGAFVGGVANNNPVVAIETIVVNNYKYKDNPVKIVMPTSPTFKNTKITVDGVKIQ